MQYNSVRSAVVVQAVSPVQTWLPVFTNPPSQPDQTKPDFFVSGFRAAMIKCESVAGHVPGGVRGNELKYVGKKCSHSKCVSKFQQRVKEEMLSRQPAV